MPELKEKILNRLGVAEAMARRAQETARKLQQAAHKHHDATNAEIGALGKQIEEAGVGQDEETEQRYCRALVTRSRMAQAGHLAGMDATRMPEVAPLSKAVNRARLEAAGQGAMNFEEQEHPRAAEGTQGQYKPGEFVPKGEQQGATGKPDHEKEPWEIPLSSLASEKAMNDRERSQYFDAEGNKIASSREKPQEADNTPIGTWRKSDYFKGSHGTEVEQLRELDPHDLVPSEDTGPERKADVERYAQWAKEGRQAPPIHVVETDKGSLKVTNGHRRWLAAKKAGTKVRAWVSPAADIPGLKDPQGNSLKTGLTHELAIHQAIEAGHKVPDEVLADYPDLKAQHDQQRKETLRQAAQEAEEDGHPGLAEAHQDLDPKEDWEKNGVRSKAFKSWFGDWESDPKNASKVVDAETGEPTETWNMRLEKNPGKTKARMVFHGTGKGGFRSFEMSKTNPNGLVGPGFYFTENPNVAKEYERKEVPKKELTQSLTDADMAALEEWKATIPSNLRSLVSSHQQDHSQAEFEDWLAHSAPAVPQVERFLSSRGVGFNQTQEVKTYSCYLNIRNPIDADKKLSSDELREIWHHWPKEHELKQGEQPGDDFETTFAEDNEGHTTVQLMGKFDRGGDWKTSNKVAIQKALQAMGYDGLTHIGGIYAGNNDVQHRVWVAWEPAQVKSSENEGDFDPNSPDIYKAVRSACGANELCRPFVPPDVPRWRGEKPGPDCYLPLNGVEDREKFRAMAREMAGGHWTWDVPLIRCGDQLLTGSHRYAAAKVAGVPVETLDAADLFREGGLDFQETWERHALPYTSWLNNMDQALKCLPHTLLQKYGVDLG